MNSLSLMNRIRCGLLLVGLCALIVSNVGCGNSNEGVAKGTAASNEPKEKPEKNSEPKRPKGEGSKTEGAANGPKMIGDIPYDVFWDQPLKIAANTQTGAAESTTVAANDASKGNTATDTPPPMKEAPKEAAAGPSLKDIIDKDTLSNEIKNVRNYLAGKTASGAISNRLELYVDTEAVLPAR